MERSGFIEKFAKAAAGVFLSPEELFGDDEPDRKYRMALPRIIKITDETLYSREGIDKEVLQRMLKSGFDNVFPDIAEQDFIKILFPGLIVGAKVGICCDVSVDYCKDAVFTPLSVVEVLCGYPGKADALQDNIDLWIPGRAKPERGTASNNTGKIKYLDDFLLNEKIDLPLLLEDRTIIPCPALSRVYQFQIGVFSPDKGKHSANPCRDLYLHCFIDEDDPDWLHQLDDKEKWSVFERIQYPQGMKFRLYIADYSPKNGAIYLGNDGILLDKLLNGESVESVSERIDLVEVINPSAPEIEGIRRVRKGDDIILEWDEVIKSVSYQIYRSERSDFRPAKKYLIGITGENRFKDEGAAKSGQCHYLVTGVWGD